MSFSSCGVRRTVVDWPGSSTQCSARAHWIASPSAISCRDWFAAAAERVRQGARNPMSQREPLRPGVWAQGSRSVDDIPVAPEMEIVATAQAAAMGEYLAMTQDKIDEVKLALVEACINAFEHADMPRRATAPDVPAGASRRGSGVARGGGPGQGQRVR